MALKVQDLHFTLLYKPGASNPADLLSRQPATPAPDISIGAEADTQYIQAIATDAIPDRLSLAEIQAATQEDPVLKVVHDAIHSNAWPHHDPAFKIYYGLRDQLSTIDGIILRQQRIIVPAKLRQQVVAAAHRGHQGIVRTRDRLTLHVWWPRLTADAEDFCRQCQHCQAGTDPDSSPPVPSHPTPASPSPWHRVFIDLYGPLPSHDHLLVIVDQYSRYPIVHRLRSITSAAVIKALRSTFCMFGAPAEVMTDNGTQFSSAAFATFLQSFAVTHRTSTPLWPQANGEVERMNRTMAKALRIAQLTGCDQSQALQEWLMAYRATPHPATKETPANLLFRHQFRDVIPSVRIIPDPDPTTIVTRESQFRADRCKAANEHRHAKARQPLTPGSTVLRRNEKPSTKLASPWLPDPWTVTTTKGHEVTLKQGSDTVTRHMTFVKPIQPAPITRPPPTPTRVTNPATASSPAIQPPTTPALAQRAHPRTAKARSQYGSK